MIATLRGGMSLDELLLIDFVKGFSKRIFPNSNVDSIDEFQREYQSFKEQPIVREYLAAELEICRLVQEINSAIDELVDIDMEIL